MQRGQYRTKKVKTIHVFELYLKKVKLPRKQQCQKTYPRTLRLDTIQLSYTRNKLLTGKLNQCYRYHKLRKAFSKFYRRHSDLVSKFNVGLKSLLQQGLSEPEFYGDLVYKFRKIYACNDFSTQFRKIILRYKKMGYNINVIRQTACMVVNPITVNNFASLFNCTSAG